MILFNQDNLREIVHSLSKNKTRTLLTIIGIVWGMFLYVSLLGISKGMENGFKIIFDESSHNSIFLWGLKTNIPYKGFQRGTPVQLTLSDAEKLKKRVKEIAILSPRNAKGVAGLPLIKVKNNHKSNRYKIFGDFPQIDLITKRSMISGRFLHHEDILQKKRICIIGEKVYEQLFSRNESYLGKYIEISGVPFKIVGMYKHTLMTEIEEDNSIFIPFSTFGQVFNTNNKVLSLAMSLNNSAKPIETEQLIRKNLKEIKNISPYDNQAFTGFNFGKEYRRFMKFLDGVEFLTTLVGILTLLSGVVSIGNILIISIKERTKEIGIKRAIGAKPAQIRLQIIMESLILTLFSGFIGFILGVGFLAFVNFIFSKNSSIPFYNPTISIFSLSLAFFIMVFFGIFIGLIPAQKAVKIKPIDAFKIE
jgi:putative ABC transport system permease protein